MTVTRMAFRLLLLSHMQGYSPLLSIDDNGQVAEIILGWTLGARFKMVSASLFYL